jgi:NTE family protein
MIGVAFEGCACRAAFQVGVAQWMEARGLRPAVLAGASSGSIVAALWAAGELERLAELWLSLAGQTVVFEPRRVLRGRWPGRMSHVLGEPLADYRHLRMADLPGLRVVVTRLGLRGPRPVVLDARADVAMVDAVLGSCFIPGPYSRPVVIQGRPAVDGAWFERVPVSALPPGPGLLVVTDPDARVHAGWPRSRVLPLPEGKVVLAPIRPLPLWGFSFDHASTVEAMAIGRASTEAFFRRGDGAALGIG